MTVTSNNEDQSKGDSLFVRYTFVVDEGQEPLRVDKFLVNRIEKATRNKLQEAIERKQVIVNEKAVKSNYKVKPGDDIVVLVDKEPNELEVLPEDVPLDVVYEDDDLMIVNKKPGMVVHPGYGNYSGTLLNALAFRLDDKATHIGNRPWLVHRIDKNTSGLLVIAKNDEAMAFLAEQFKNHTIERTYQALVWGVVEEDEGTISSIIGRDQYDRKRFVVLDNDSDRGNML